MQTITKSRRRHFPNLNEAQRKQIERQLEEHNHSNYTTDIELEGIILKGFQVNADVMRPEVMASKILAEYIWKNNHLVKDKVVIDMGCGSGIQGIVAGLAGAKKVLFTDFSNATVKNTGNNVVKYGLQNKSEMVKGDLFEAINEKADVIIFNHPFFADNPLNDIPVSFAMLEPGNLLQRFFSQAKNYCKERIIMPFYHLAGEVNNPDIQCKKFNFKVSKEKITEMNLGLQKGEFSIYEIIA